MRRYVMAALLLAGPSLGGLHPLGAWVTGRGTPPQALLGGALATAAAVSVSGLIGFVGLVILLALAVTSTDRMLRRMGGKRWAALHRLVYGAAALAVVHFFIQSKADVNEPFVMGGLFLWLMLWRVLSRYGLLPRGARAVLVLILLAILSAAATAGAEALYYHLKSGIDVMRVLATNWLLGVRIRPSWIVGGATLAVALGAALRPLWAKPSGGRRRAAAA